MSVRQKVYRIDLKLSYGRRFFSFLLLSLSLFIVLYNFILPITSYFDPQTYSPVAGIFLAIIPFVFGAALGSKRSVLVYKEKKQIHLTKSVSLIPYSRKVIPFERLEYVTILKNTHDYYEARLFYDDGDRLSLFELKHADAARVKVHKMAAALAIPVNNLIREGSAAEQLAPFVPKAERELSKVLSEGEKPLWQNALAALFFTASIISLYFFFLLFYRSGFDTSEGMEWIIQLSMTCGVLAVGLSRVKDYLFDFKNGQYKMVNRIGPLRFGRWKILKSVDYISVFQKHGWEYHVNVWYNINRHFNLSKQEDQEVAMDIAKKVAVQFGIDILDATDPFDKKWIETNTDP